MRLPSRASFMILHLQQSSMIATGRTHLTMAWPMIAGPVSVLQELSSFQAS